MPGHDPAAAADLQRRVTRLVEAVPGRWSVAVRGEDLDLDLAADDVHRAASTVKLPLLVAVLREVDRGRLDLAATLPVPVRRSAGSGVLVRLPSVTALSLGEALDLMTSGSDNTATAMVVEVLGVLEDAAASVAGLGLPATHLRRVPGSAPADGPGAETTTTARDLAACLEGLRTEGVLTPSSGSLARELLGRQTVRDRLPALLDPSVRCLHKTGEVDDVRHDAGILETDAWAATVVVLGSDLPGATGERVEHRGARLVAGGVAREVARAAARSAGRPAE